MMKYLLAAIDILLLIVISFISAGDRLGYNNCMIQAKSDYALERGAEHTVAICRAFFIEHKMVNE